MGSRGRRAQHLPRAGRRARRVARGEALAPTASAASIRGGSTVTEGPFVQTNGSINGYYVIEARDLEHAVEIATQCPAPGGGVEVRAVVDPSTNPF
ncbi:YciI family protein [Microbacterium sp. NPDC057407]|uniref:YciI family protein n=1 Tax=Microbacterium sp. NPDC057407 TaxID=3346120 RepID=UPI00366D420C